MNVIPSQASMQDVEFPVLRAVMQFMYTGEYDDQPTSGMQVEDVLLAADKYDIASLIAKCESDVAGTLNRENAVKCFIVADAIGSGKLKQRVIDFINTDGPNMSQREDFKALKVSHPHLLEELLSAVYARGKPRNW